MSYNSLAFSIGAGLGPVIGGPLTTFLGWQWNFFINVVIGIVSITLCWIYLPNVPRFREAEMDWLGGILVLVALIILILGFTFIPPDQGKTWLGVVLVLVGIALLVLFVFWELRHPFAIIPRKILMDKRLIFSLLGALLNFALITPVTFQMPFCLQGMRCIAPWAVGLMCLVSPVAQMIAAIVGRLLAQKVTSFYIKVVTSVFIAAIVIIFGFIVQYQIWGIMVTAFCFAFVLMLYFVSNNMFMMQTASADVRGMIGGCMQAFRESGLAIGIALSNLISELFIQARWGREQPKPNEDCTGPQEFLDYKGVYFEVVWITDLVMSVLAVLALLFGALSGFGDFEYKLVGFPRARRAEAEAGFLRALAERQALVDAQKRAAEAEAEAAEGGQVDAPPPADDVPETAPLIAEE